MRCCSAVLCLGNNSMPEQTPVRMSALWAAYGDALGFITELASKSILRRRVDETPVQSLVPWVRRIGGRFGTNVPLPQGCYSDDTQLRLATCRAIRGDGVFDVEAFAKVELPVWRSYALGAGRGTKTAARALATPSVQWCANFHRMRGVNYVDGGGNGAAMRIQPHVWCTSDREDNSSLLLAVIQNAVTTHGHPRGIVGAAFHALCLRLALWAQKVPGPAEWQDVAQELAVIPGILRSDEQLGSFWVPTWETATKQSLDIAFENTVQEVLRDVDLAREAATQDRGGSIASRYEKLLRASGCMDRASVGSGTKTAVAASYLAYVAGGEPTEALQACVNLLGSDTDSIGTMAGALLGAACKYDPPEAVADKEYIEKEALRLQAITGRRTCTSFAYPDLLYWRAPERELDCLGLKGKQWILSGLGEVYPVGEPVAERSDGTSWQWFKLPHNQQVLLKRRAKPQDLEREALPAAFSSSQDTRSDKVQHKKESRSSVACPGHLFDDPAERAAGPLSLDEATDRAIRSHFAPEVIGRLLLRLSEEENGMELAIAFAAVVAKAKRARARRGTS